MKKEIKQKNKPIKHKYFVGYLGEGQAMYGKNLKE
jgi:hypothetical protein